MKIGIITLHRVFNYGSVLQAYATQLLFKRNGHEVEIIDYITEQRTFRRLIQMVPNSRMKGLKKWIYQVGRFCSLILKQITFSKFIRKYLKISKRRYISFADLCKNPPKADLYVVGSDQVWNSDYNEGIDRGFFLEFVPKGVKRIAYASSFGKDELNYTEIEETKRLIHKFSNISVREDSAVCILDKLGYSGAVCVLDPTLQVERSEWEKLASKRLIEEKYLLLFLLYNEDNGGTQFAQQIALEKGLKVVKLSWGLRKNRGIDILKTHRTPEDFLSLVQHADFVVTNSFHGLAFSLNFNKQFVAIPRDQYNTRLESLLRLVGLEDRLVKHPTGLSVTQSSIDYNKVNAIIDRERKKAEQFIENVLKDVTSPYEMEEIQIENSIC